MSSLVLDLQVENVRSLPLVADMGLDDNSPFGLQGLARESIELLKPDAIKPLAAALALSGNRDQIRDPALTEKIVARNSGWVDEYSVVRLIERSLWFNGQSDFVMQMTRNPSQIPDNPPAEVQAALLKAYALHPQATVWYGVPLFSDENNSDGLPVPLTAAQVKEEAQRRLQAAQKHAEGLGWFYRTLLRVNRLPQTCRHKIRKEALRIKSLWQRTVAEFRQARLDAKNRARAKARADFEYFRTGKSSTVIPKHSTRIGQIASRAAQSLLMMEQRVDRSAEFTEEFLERHAYAAVGLAVLPMMALQVVPLFLAPAAVIACDPFLFIELPDEPGKLRMLGHWYWQAKEDGTKKLHVHV